MLSGLISLLAPGTIIQSFAMCLFSLVFMVLHAVKILQVRLDIGATGATWRC